MFAVEGGETDAEVVGQAGEEEALEAALAEVASQAGWSGVVVFEEGGVAVDVAAETFAEDQFGVGDVECRVEGRAGVRERSIQRKSRSARGAQWQLQNAKNFMNVK